jgi:hypothetical protein
VIGGVAIEAHSKPMLPVPPHRTPGAGASPDAAGCVNGHGVEDQRDGAMIYQFSIALY